MCYASFHGLIEGDSFDYSGANAVNMAPQYIFPLFMAVALYFIDGIYNGLLLFKHDRPFHGIVIMAAILVFLVSFTFSVYLNCLCARFCMFLVAWCALGGLKYYETPTLNLEDEDFSEAIAITAD